jgi:hypothetical protein
MQEGGLEKIKKAGATEYTRRQFLTGVAAGTVTGIGVGGSGIALLKYRQERHKTAAEQQEEEPRVFADDTIYVPIKARETFESFGGNRRLFAHPVPEFRMNTLPVRNMSTSRVVAELERLEHKGALHRITLHDIEHNTRAYRALTRISTVEENWRCRGVGMGSRRTPDNDPRYLRVTPYAEAILEEVTSKFQGALRAAELSQEWRIRPIVTGLLRSAGPGGTNDIEGASDESPHTYGVGIDLSLSRFDIIRRLNQEFFMTSNSEVDRDLVRTLSGILAGVLKKMHDNDKFVLTYEPRRGHFHLSLVRVRR